MRKVVCVALLAFAGSPLCFGVSKEMVELQRDVSSLQDAVKTIQRTLDEKFSAIQTLQQQQADNTIKTQQQMTSLENGLPGTVGAGLRPIANLGERVNAMGDDVHALQSTLNELNTRLERMDAKITDLKNQISISQNPPPAPGTTVPAQGQLGTGQQGAPTQGPPMATPPMGMSAEKSYTDARRDLQAGNAPLAQKEFHDYLTYFPNTEYAPGAQYYIGQIYFNQGDYAGAIQAFDAVLERYPENPRSADAHLMKGQALLKSNQRNKAVQEFRTVVTNYPKTDDARQALFQLRQLGVASASAGTSRRK